MRQENEIEDAALPPLSAQHEACSGRLTPPLRPITLANKLLSPPSKRRVKMSDDKGKGRADRANNQYRPPTPGILDGILGSQNELKNFEKRRHEYDEGYADKDRELKEEKGRR